MFLVSLSKSSGTISVIHCHGLNKFNCTAQEAPVPTEIASEATESDEDSGPEASELFSSV